MIYKVNYKIKEVEKFDKNNSGVPSYVVAEDFYSALKTAKKFETDNLSLLECTIHVNGEDVAIATGYRGFKPSSKDEAVA